MYTAAVEVYITLGGSMTDRRILRQKFEISLDVEEHDQALYQYFSKTGYGLRLQQSRKQSIQRRVSAKSCPCCCNSLHVVHDETTEDLTIERVIYIVCDACGFWTRTHHDSAVSSTHTIPFTIELNPRQEAQSLSHLASTVYKQPSLLHTMDSRQFELFVGSILKDFYDCEVWHVGRAGDDGVDLMLIEKSTPVLIQVKRRMNPTATEGIDVVKLLFASALVKGADRGMIVTTAQRFSPAAKKWIHMPKLKDLSFALELVDVNRLLSMMHVVRPPGADEPWQTHMARHRNREYRENKPFNWHVVSDGIVVMDMSRRDLLYMFSARHPGRCKSAVMSPEALGEVSRNGSDLSELTISYMAEKAEMVSWVEDDHLADILSALDRTTLGGISKCWRERDPKLLFDLSENW